jgi:hypothetical protein
MSYYELWAIMNNWRREFSNAEFARTFPSPNPRKVLHDMAKKGLLEHLEYGKYRVKPMDDYVKTKNDVRGAYELLKRAEHPYALSDVDAVFAWTHGGYNVGRFFGYYPVHLRVREDEVENWKRFFRNNGKKAFRVDETPKETTFGVFYLLHPTKRIESETVEGLEVEPLKETVEFAKKNVYAYEPALEMLDEEYKLGLGIRYSG